MNGSDSIQNDTPNKVRVLIADDHEIIRDGVKFMLRDSPLIRVTSEAKHGKEAIAIAMKERPDLIIMDISMPEMDGIEATRELHQVLPEIYILGFSVNDDLYSISRLVEAGAHGYVLKTTGFEQLVAAIEVIMADGYFFSKEVGAQMMRYFMKPGKNGQAIISSTLSQMEENILNQLKSGLNPEEICGKFRLSRLAADTHIRNILLKKNAVHIRELFDS
ncbi:MAG: response regulator transcription factor [Flavobacteriales bacterium]|nr:response regulator transcription factor [Flavobacteriales bacterium]MCB9447585.1 response regulator transcription factor [Flavobacteriales bacterium]